METKLKEVTEKMSGKEKIEYILTYYWYHILGIIALFCLVLFIVVHFVFSQEDIVFSLAMVNQEIDYERDEEMEQSFAETSGLDQDEIVIDSDYNISYSGHTLTGANESSFDKFFIKWANGEIDAVIATKDFLEYCVSVGAEFYSIDSFEVGELKTYKENGISGIDVTESSISENLHTEEALYLVFPKEAEHKEQCQKFLTYIIEEEES